MDAQLSPSTPTHNDSPFKSILAAAAVGNTKNPHPSFGRGSSNKAGQKFIACANGPPIPLRPDGKRKRVHPTREQQALLETFFQTTPKPNSKERADICNQVNINMRSVQVWFQNRRAKSKKEADSRSHEDLAADSSDCGTSAVAMSAEAEPARPSNLQLEAQQLYQFQPPQLHIQNSEPQSSMQTIENHQTMVQRNASDASSHWISNPGSTRILATELRIGTWRRVTSTGNDLVLEVNPFEGILRWMLIESGHTFKLELPIAYVVDVSIHPAPESATLSRLCLELSSQATPLFYCEARNVSQGNRPTGIFVDSPDFTENQQASFSRQHSIEGPSNEMEKLFIILSEYFQAVQQAQTCQDAAAAGDASVLSYFSSDAAPLSAMSSMLTPLSMSHRHHQGLQESAIPFNPTFASVMVYPPGEDFVNNDAGLGIMAGLANGDTDSVTQNERHLPSPPEHTGTFDAYLQRAIGGYDGQGMRK
ncbi:hypothetical protein HDU78_009715 [Chytriomyces hyalinus]|nr:hypothetical protein HDU78_009715 [Chytriomyces hyalinus]